MRGLGAPVLVSKRRMGILYVTRFKSSIGELTLASSEKGLAYVGLPRASGRGLMGWSRRHAPDEVLEEAPEACAEPTLLAMVLVRIGYRWPDLLNELMVRRATHHPAWQPQHDP